jgi:ADP-ribosyl-[dinitrogen reductase] hydrolase
MSRSIRALLGNPDVATAGILGLAVGDALGVPVEFRSRESLRREPVTSMRGYSSHNQPPGTWSDDTSLALCLAESICENGIDFDDQAGRFVGWMLRGEWTPHGKVFDIGNATREAILLLDGVAAPTEAGSTDERSNGNGSLMRILPIAIYLAYSTPAERIDVAMTGSRLTHGHPRCQLACAYFVEVAAAMIRGTAISDAIAEAREAIKIILAERHPSEETKFARLFSADFESLPESDLSGSGYVIHCLESSLWCAAGADSYAVGVLRAVNLGDDTDTTGAVTGGLLGLRFGQSAIPEEWVEQLARRDDILALGDRFQRVCQRKWEADL